MKYDNKSGGILTLDYHKAFDTVNKIFLISVMKEFNFSPAFIQWVSVLMEDTECSVQYAGGCQSGSQLNVE